MLSKEQIPSCLEIPQEGRLLLAFSGGSDSLALMYLLSILAKERTEALYINHNIRSEQELALEIALNKKNAEKLGIKLDIIAIKRGDVEELSAKKGCGIEAAARELRYNALKGYAEKNGFDYILTAHHQEDQIETLLMRILDGSPFYTYQGILYKDGNIIRPLLRVSKADIMDVIASSGLEYSTDSTNLELGYRRNRIRHLIVASLSGEEKTILSNIARNVYRFRQRNKTLLKPVFFPSYASLGLEDFLNATSIERERAIFSISSYLGNPERLSRAFIAQLFAISKKGCGRAHSAFLDFIVSKTEIRVFKKIAPFSMPFDCGMTEVGPFKVSKKYDGKTLRLDPSLIGNNLVIRTSEADDVISLKEGTKKVRELEKRAHVPYSVVLESDKGIVAVFLRQFSANDRIGYRFYSDKGTPFMII